MPMKNPGLIPTTDTPLYRTRYLPADGSHAEGQLRAHTPWATVDTDLTSVTLAKLRSATGMPGAARAAIVAAIAADPELA